MAAGALDFSAVLDNVARCGYARESELSASERASASVQRLFWPPPAERISEPRNLNLAVSETRGLDWSILTRRCKRALTCSWRAHIRRVAGRVPQDGSYAVSARRAVAPDYCRRPQWGALEATKRKMGDSMELLDTHTEHETDHNSLTQRQDGLPAEYYFEAKHYQRELERIWYRNWIYVGRCEALLLPRSFCTVEIGDQRVLLVRDEGGTVRGFYNTCRHRGSALCREAQGRLQTAAIVCPYHAWVYDLRGKLLRTSSKSQAQGFALDDFPLYRVLVQEWGGCIFIALTDNPSPLQQNFDQPLNRLDHWALKNLRRGHVFTKTMQCNWKVFWENYNECLHCPGVHAQLSQLVPIFGRGLLEERDDPKWRQYADSKDPKFKGGLKHGASTWSANGQAIGASLPGLNEEDRQAAHVYVTSLPSVFIVGHPDYVRIVRLRPLGPEQTEMCVEYLFAPATLADSRFDMRNATDFADRVMSEDAQICELNQQGLHARPYRHGVVMPEEYLVRQFQDWVRVQLAAD